MSNGKTDREASDILHTLQSNPKVFIRDPKSVERKLKTLIDGGFDKLMVISDFDYTISRFKDENDEKCWTTHGIFDNCAKQLSVELQQKFHELKEKYLPIEFDPKMSIEEKTPYMLAWWKESHAYIKDNKFKRQMIEQAVYDSKVKLRDGAAEFLKNVCAKSVPLVCFSAGIGNLIEIFLKWKLGNVPENLHIISNQMNFDAEDFCTGFSDPLIHTFNKNASVVNKERPYFHSIRNRPYVLLLGDSLGDIHMDVGVEEEGEALRIGYLNFNFDELRDEYQRSYDIVLTDDQTFNVPTIIFTHIHDSIKAARESRSNLGAVVEKVDQAIEVKS